MAYDDATIHPQHVSPPGYSSCGTGTHMVPSKPRDGIMERLIPQDPMIIAASSRVALHTTNTALRPAGQNSAKRRRSGDGGRSSGRLGLTNFVKCFDAGSEASNRTG